MVRIDVALPAIIFLQSGGMAIAALQDVWKYAKESQRMALELQQLQPSQERGAATALRSQPRPAIETPPSEEDTVALMPHNSHLMVQRARQERRRDVSRDQAYEVAAAYYESALVYREHVELSTMLSAARATSLAYMSTSFWRDTVGIARGAGRPWATLSNGQGHRFVGSPEYHALPDAARDTLRTEAISNLVKRMFRVITMSTVMWAGSVLVLRAMGYEDASPWMSLMDAPTRPLGLLPEQDAADAAAAAGIPQDDQ